MRTLPLIGLGIIILLLVSGCAGRRNQPQPNAPEQPKSPAETGITPEVGEPTPEMNETPLQPSEPGEQIPPAQTKLNITQTDMNTLATALNNMNYEDLGGLSNQ